MARVVRATASRPGVPHPGALATPAADGVAADATGDAVTAFVKRFTSSGGEVARTDPGRPPGEWLHGFLRGLEPRIVGVAVAPDVPPELRPRLPEATAAHAGAGVSMAWGASADTGSLVLPSTGTRAVQLLPPVHVVWVPTRRVFARLEDALLELEAELPAAVGLHSGPSKSADIGRTVVTGVHGPGRCIAVVS